MMMKPGEKLLLEGCHCVKVETAGVDPLKPEVDGWLKKAEEDYGTSEDCFKSERFSASAFFSQQAAEKSLKALQIERLGRFDKVHDLLTLASSVNAPDDVVRSCVRLTPYYVITRYPDVEGPITKEIAQSLLEESKKVTNWVKQVLKP